MSNKNKKNNKLNILEVNNIDLPGRRFNGYDIMQEINHNCNEFRCSQIVTYKQSDDDKVAKFYDNSFELELEYKLLEAEKEILSVHNVLSLTSNILANHELFEKSDIVHYHMVHNTKLSMCNFDELVSRKPTIISLHDPWWFTGRCVHPEECEQWKTGCSTCHKLHNLFELPQDNCSSLWDLKKSVYKNMDVDIIISSPFMQKCIDDCNMTNFKNVHVIPFGIDLELFKPKMSQEEARKKIGVNQNSDIVVFLRAQKAHKGTEYVNEALDMLKTDKKITILTCSEKHLLDNLKDKYEIIDLGQINDEQIRLAYTACDMFLMPSIGESFGLMAIEAMASSKPIVVFDNTALPYVTFAPECGVLVENKNSKKLMEAIKMLIDDSTERLRRGNLGRQICEENYDVEKYNAKIIEVYKKAIKRQKNKKLIKYNLDIDYSKQEVISLILKLRKVYKKLGFKTKIRKCELFNKKFKINDKDLKINYADEDIKKVIIVFNNFIYFVYENEFVKNRSIFNKDNKIKFIDKLKEKYKERIIKHPLLFKFLSKIYHFIKTIIRKFRRR